MKIVPMEVDLVDHMGGDLTVVNAARVSFDAASSWEERCWSCNALIGSDDLCPECNADNSGRDADDRRLSERDAKLIKYLADHNHWSPFAHTSIQLRVKAPIFVARQLVKHQVGGVWNEVSRRYVDSEPEFFFPDVWRGRPDGSIKQGSSGEIDISEIKGTAISPANSALNALCCYDELLQRGVAPEQARMVLPQNMMCDWYWTGSLAFFHRVCKERFHPKAQAETAEVARQIAAIVEPLFPVSWAALMNKEPK